MANNTNRTDQDRTRQASNTDTPDLNRDSRHRDAQSDRTRDQNDGMRDPGRDETRQSRSGRDNSSREH